MIYTKQIFDKKADKVNVKNHSKGRLLFFFNLFFVHLICLLFFVLFYFAFCIFVLFLLFFNITFLSFDEDTLQSLF